MRHCAGMVVAFALQEGYKAFLPNVNEVLGRGAGLRNSLWGFNEKISKAAPEVKQCSGEDRANALKDQEPGTRIDVGVGLTLKGKAERNKKHQRDGEIFQMMSHSYSLGRIVYVGQPCFG